MRRSRCSKDYREFVGRKFAQSALVVGGLVNLPSAVPIEVINNTGWKERTQFVGIVEVGRCARLRGENDPLLES